jgi:hypothetical protein
MTRPLFLKIVEAVEAHDNYFTQKADACGQMGLHPLVKVTVWCAILVSSIKCGKKDQFLYIIGIKIDILLHNPTLQGPKPIITHQKHSVLHA